MTRTDYLLGALLVLGFLAYSTGFGGPFLFDDFGALSANALLRIDGTVFDAWRSAALSSGSGPLRRPIADVYFRAQSCRTRRRLALCPQTGQRLAPRRHWRTGLFAGQRAVHAAAPRRRSYTGALAGPTHCRYLAAAPAACLDRAVRRTAHGAVGSAVHGRRIAGVRALPRSAGRALARAPQRS